jgi:Gpi18-like mannosyltransferase
MNAAHTVKTAHLVQFRAWLKTTEGKRLIGLLGLAALVRVGLSYFLRVSPDLQAYENWGELILRDFFHPYSYGVQHNSIWLVPAYPPLTMYLYAIIDFFYFGTAHILGLHVSHCSCSPVFRPILLIPGILTDLAQVFIIYMLARTKLSPSHALLVAATYAFSPAVLIDDVGWGQTDNLALLIAVGALLLALRHNGLWAGVLMGLAIALKPEPWIYIPLVLVYLYRWAGTQQALRAVASTLGIALVLWAPYLLPPRPEIFAWQLTVQKIEQAAGLYATRNAYNLWWLLGTQHLSMNAPYLGPFSAQALGGTLFLVVLLVAMVGVWLDSSMGRLWTSAALISIAFFDVGILQYERYIFPAVGFFLLAALYERRYWTIYAVVSLSAFVCLGATIFTEGYGLAAHLHGVHRIGAILASPTVTFGIAAINVGMLLLTAWMVLSPPSSRSQLERQARIGEQKSPASSPQLVP